MCDLLFESVYVRSVTREMTERIKTMRVAIDQFKHTTTNNQLVEVGAEAERWTIGKRETRKEKQREKKRPPIVSSCYLFQSGGNYAVNCSNIDSLFMALSSLKLSSKWIPSKRRCLRNDQKTIVPSFCDSVLMSSSFVPFSRADREF